MKVTIYHNPRCSKSRQTLELLSENDINPEVIEYLKTPPNEQELKQILSMLQITARELMRQNEEVYKSNNLGDTNLSEDELIQAMIDNPILIERPIVVAGDKAVIGRPPENVKQLLS